MSPFKSNPNTVRRGCILIARNMIEIVPNKPMQLLEENFSDRAIGKHKVMKVAVETDMYRQLVQLGYRSNLNQIWKVRFGEHL